MRRSALVLVLASVLLTGAVSPAVTSGDSTPGTGATPSADRAPSVGSPPRAQGGLPRPFSVHDGDGAAIHATQEIWLTPSTPGEVRIQFRFEIPSRVISMRTAVPDDARVTDSVGFRQGSGREYHWNGSTNRPSVTFTLPVNESVNASSPEHARGDAVAVDAGEWALFRRPRMPTQWESYDTGDPIEFERNVTTVGPGAAGEWLVYLGDHATYERDAHDQRFRLVVPSTANMTARPETVLDSLADASDALRVGDRDEDVFVVAAPTGEVAWGVRGLQTGDADLWVRDVEPVASASNAWLHEYVHSRQAFELAPEMRWFREASASYYAALLTFEQHRVDYAAFRNRISTGTNGADADAVLANRSTWEGAPSYDKGALVAGRIDRRIRNARDRERTLQTVFRAMNGGYGRTSLSDFLNHLDEHGDGTVVDAGARYVDTASDVSVWNRTAHLAAFGNRPARIGFQLSCEANGAAYRVNGSYRNATVGDRGEPLVLVPGERLRVGALVENAGGTTGNYTASLAVNGTVVDRVDGSVAPNETVTAPLAHTFTETGTYDLSLDGDNVTVRVREPADARVVDVTASSRTALQGGSVTLSAAVRNDGSVPAETSVVFRRDGEAVATERATVGPERIERVNATIAMSEIGATAVGVEGGRTITVAVRPAPVRTTDEDRTTSASDGNGTTGLTFASNGRATARYVGGNEPVSGGTGPGPGTLTGATAGVIGVALALLRVRTE